MLLVAPGHGIPAPKLRLNSTVLRPPGCTCPSGVLMMPGLRGGRSFWPPSLSQAPWLLAMSEEVRREERKDSWAQKRQVEPADPRPAEFKQNPFGSEPRRPWRMRGTWWQRVEGTLAFGVAFPPAAPTDSGRSGGGNGDLYCTSRPEAGLEQPWVTKPPSAWGGLHPLWRKRSWF